MNRRSREAEFAAIRMLAAASRAASSGFGGVAPARSLGAGPTRTRPPRGGPGRRPLPGRLDRKAGLSQGRFGGMEDPANRRPSLSLGEGHRIQGVGLRPAQRQAHQTGFAVQERVGHVANGVGMELVLDEEGQVLARLHPLLQELSCPHAERERREISAAVRSGSVVWGGGDFARDRSTSGRSHRSGPLEARHPIVPLALVPLAGLPLDEAGPTLCKVLQVMSGWLKPAGKDPRGPFSEWFSGATPDHPDIPLTTLCSGDGDRRAVIPTSASPVTSTVGPVTTIPSAVISMARAARDRDPLGRDRDHALGHRERDRLGRDRDRVLGHGDRDPQRVNLQRRLLGFERDQKRGEAVIPGGSSRCSWVPG